MSKLLKLLFSSILILIIIGIIQLNVKSYRTIKFKNGINQDVLHQLYFLKEQMHQGEADRMQQLFPEGFVFLNALYGLTWIELIEKLKPTHEIYQEGMVEIDWALKAILSDQGKAIFPKNIIPQYGAFYNGWSNYLLARKLAIQSNKNRTAKDITHFQQSCERIANAFLSVANRTAYLESYKVQTWPADNILCIAALSWHDQLFTPKYTTLIKTWLTQVQKRLDPKTGLIPHAVSPLTGKVKEGARGSSQSLMNNFLIEIDSTFGAEQFKKYKALFLDYRFGLPGIREYPKGEKGNGDIDSGPVILNIGGAASIVGMRSMERYNELDVAIGLRNAVEGFGVAYCNNKQKKHLFGTLPMADAFIAWGNVAVKENTNRNSNNWRWAFHFQSIIFSIICLLILFFLYKKVSPSKSSS